MTAPTPVCPISPVAPARGTTTRMVGGHPGRDRISGIVVLHETIPRTRRVQKWLTAAIHEAARS